MPIVHSFAILLEMLRNMVAPFPPVDTEMQTKAATPTSASPAVVPCHLKMPIPLASLAMVTCLMMVEEVFFKEIDGTAKVAFEDKAPFLVGFFVTLPVIFLDEWFFTRSTPVPWFS